MPRRQAGIKGLLTDYSSMSRMMKLFENDMGKARAEYSRQRSIVRKRVERMAEAGETANSTYRRFGDVSTQLPSVRDLTDAQVMEMLMRTSQAIAGGHVSTLSQIRASRKEFISGLIDSARDAGDDEAADALAKASDAQIRRMQTIMGMVQRVAGKQMTSDELAETALKLVMKAGPKANLLNVAANVINELGIDTGDDNATALEALKERFTAKGGTRVSWSKAQKRRGR